MNFTITKKDIILDAFRQFRKRQFQAFDIWEKAVLMGREATNDAVYSWYQNMLDFPKTITENTKTINYPITPECIRKYLF